MIRRLIEWWQYRRTVKAMRRVAAAFRPPANYKNRD